MDNLKIIIDRLELLDDQKRNISDEQKDIMSDAKSSGFDVAAIKKIIAIRKADKQKLDELDAIVEIYKDALGMD